MYADAKYEEKNLSPLGKCVNIIHIIYLPYNHGVDLEYFLVLRNGRLFWETLYQQIISLHKKEISDLKIKYGRNKSV